LALQERTYTLTSEYSSLGNGRPTVCQPTLVPFLQYANTKAKVKINEYVCNAEFKETVTIFRSRENKM